MDKRVLSAAEHLRHVKLRRLREPDSLQQPSAASVPTFGDVFAQVLALNKLGKNHKVCFVWPYVQSIPKGKHPPLMVLSHELNDKTTISV